MSPAFEQGFFVSEVSMNRDTLDPGVRDAVVLLQSLGFVTTDSGDGYSKAELIKSGDALDVPHIFIRVKTHALLSEADRLAALVTPRVTYPTPGALALFQNPRIEATYSPIDGVATIALYGDPPF